jgi:hypothetical protein
MRHTPMQADRARSWRFVVVSLTIVMVATALTLPAEEPGDPPEAVTADAMDWWSVDAGGGRTSGGTWMAISAIGQFDAGTLSAGAVTMNGGFVVADEPGEPPLFTDGFETGDLGAWSSVSP